ncbi:MAG: hypothetical protein ACK2UH_05540 [Candidatus Promineifilaceae bacterium]
MEMAEAARTRIFTSGVLAGVAGLLVFLVVHHLWIVPIWFIAPIGLPIAAAGGAAVGWAYDELSPRLPARPWTVLAVVALIWVILLPGIVLAELRRPFFTLEPDGSTILAVSVGRVAVGFLVELLVTSVLVGALAGRVIGGTRRAALATAVAGFVFALGPGHNIPFIGGTSGLGKELVIMAAIIFVSAVVLVETQALAERLPIRKKPPESGSIDRSSLVQELEDEPFNRIR